MAHLRYSVKISFWQKVLFFQPFPSPQTFTLPSRTLDRNLDKKLYILNSSIVSGDFHCIDNANACNFILSPEKWKQRFFFIIYTNLSSALRHLQTRPMDNKSPLFSNYLHSHPSISRSNKYSQGFSLTLSWIFICLTLSWISSVGEKVVKKNSFF